MINSNSTITNQFVPNFSIENILNGQILIYDATKNAFINTSSLGQLIKVDGTQIKPNSVGVVHLSTSNTGTSGQVLGIDVNGDLTYLSLSSGGIASLAGLTDTGISSPIDGQFLKYNSGLWENSSVGLNDLQTVNVGAAVNKDVLFFNGTEWVNKQVDYTDIDNTPQIPINGGFTLIGLGDTDPVSVANGILRWNATADEIIYVSTLTAADITGLADVAYSGDYTDLVNTPNMGLYTLTSSLSTVALTGDYNDIANRPFIATTLTGLTDTTVLNPTSGQFLKYDGSQWVNTTVSTPANLDDLNDVDVATVVNNDILKYDSTAQEWINSTISWSEITGKPSTFTPATHTHVPSDITGLSAWMTANNNVLSLVGLNDTANVIVNGGFLKWNSLGTSIEYVSTIPAASVSGLATVATSGLYSDLSGKPTLSTVATSGLYSDLSGKPTLVTNLDGLSDVVINTPVLNQGLVYNGINWANQQINYNNLSNLPQLVTSLDDLSDVDLTTAPTASQYLKYNGTEWVASTVSFNDLSNKPTSASYTFTGLQQTSDTAIANGYLRWNSFGTEVQYTTTIPSTAITGLSVVATTGSYNDLVDTPTLFDGQYSSLTGVPSTFAPSTHTHTSNQITDLNIPQVLDDLDDTVIATPVSGDMLRYNGTNWVNTPFTLSSKSIDELSDVTITTPASNQFLKYNGSAWVNSAVDYTTLTNVPSTFSPATHTHAVADITGLNTWLSNNNSLVSFTGLSQTDNTIVPDGYLKWNSGGTSVSYVTTIPAASVSGLATVATSGLYSDLVGSPSVPVLIDDLSDVNTTGAIANYYLRYNGTNWISASIAYAHIIGAPTSASYTFTGLQQTDDTIVPDGYLKWNSGGTSVSYVTTIPAASVSGLATVATSGLYSDLVGSPSIPTNNSFSFVGLSDTNNTPVSNGYLRWNTLANSVDYVASIPASVITGLATVSTSGDYVDLINKPNLGVYALSSSLATVATTGAYSDLTGTPNLANYALISSLAAVATSGDYDDLINKPNLANYALVSSLSTVATTNDYADLNNLPAIPTNNSFTIEGLSNVNDTPVANAYLRWNSDANAVIFQTTIPYSVIDGLSTVANTGDFADLTNKPTSASYTFTGLQQTDGTIVPEAYLRWNVGGTSIEYVSSIPTADISGLSLVATSGLYSDLSGLPTLFDGQYSSLTGVPSTFAPSTHNHVVADITDFPTLKENLSELDDVDLTVPPTSGQVLKWDSGVSKWKAGSPVTFEDIDGVQGVGVPNAYLRWNGAGTTILYETNIAAENITGLSSVATSGNLHDITNVNVTTVADGDILSYNSTTEQWENNPQVVSLSGHYLNELDDVVISTPVDGKVLRHNGVNWVDAVLSFNDLSSAPTNDSYTLLGLYDTNNTIVNDGYLKWNSTGDAVEYSATIPYTAITGLATVANTGSFNDLIDAPAVPTNIDDLADVTITSPSNGHILTYNSGFWVSAPQSIPSMTLNDLSDTIIVGQLTDQVVSWTGSNWINKTLDLSMVSDVNITTPSNNEVLKYDAGSQTWVNTFIDYSEIVNNVPFSFADLDDVQTPAYPTHSDKFLRWNNAVSQVQYTDITLNDLTSVVITGAVADDVLQYNGTNWINSSLSSVLGSFKIEDLSNVPSPSSPTTDSQYLRWNAGSTSIEFVDISASELTGIQQVALTGLLNDLADVQTPSPSSGQVLSYNGSLWEATDISLTDSWQIKNTNYTAVVNDKLMVDTSSGLIDITLPASPSINDVVKVCDLNGTFNVNNCNILRNGKLIMGLAEDMSISLANVSITLTYLGVGIGWKITDGLGELSTSSKEITTNTTLYVSTTGNDITGDGTVGSPYATVQKALDSLAGYYIARDVYVTINVAAGVYVHTDSIIINHVHGDRIKIIGQTNSISQTITSTDTLTAGTIFTDASYTYNVSNTTGFALGDYVVVKMTSGSGDIHLIDGVFIIDSIDVDASITVTSIRGIYAQVAYDSITGATGTITRQETILLFNGCDGFNVGGSKIGLVDKLVIAGNLTTSTNGIKIGPTDGSDTDKSVTGGNVLLGDDVAICKFSTGINSSNGSYFNSSRVVISDVSVGLRVNSSSSAISRYSIITHCTSTAVECNLNSTINVGNSIIKTVGGLTTGFIFVAYVCSSISADNCVYDGFNASNEYVVSAFGNSYIHTDTQTHVDYIPNMNSSGNENSYISNA